ncbi:MAG: ANTAR domain-containing protein [Oscillospiraceae bacterium]|nr:ANTAR domain-containing protein [Oscillospiraceae bacterium]
MEEVLVVSTPKQAETLCGLLKECGLNDMRCVQSGGEARRLLAQASYEMVLINTPLSDEFGHELARFCALQTDAGVAVLVNAAHADDVSADIEDDGAFVVAKPVNRPMLFQAIKLIRASRRRMLGLHQENIRLQGKLEEIRLVNRAKSVLMEYVHMTEPQAHRHIEKRAMDTRQSRREIAESILKTYEK